MEGTITPGHFGIGLNSGDDFFFTGFIAEMPLLEGKWVVAPSLGMLWYDYALEGDGGPVSETSRSLGINYYLMPLKLELFTGYNLRQGKDIPAGSKLAPGISADDYETKAEGNYYLYFRNMLFQLETLLDLNFAPNARDLAKTYLQSLFKTSTSVKVGLVYNHVLSNLDYMSVTSETSGVPHKKTETRTQEHYETSILIRKDFTLVSGVGKRRINKTKSNYGGYWFVKYGKAFEVAPQTEETYHSQFNAGGHTFFLAEASSWYLLGISQSEENGLGYRLGINYAISGTSKAVLRTGLPKFGREWSTVKNFWVTMTYQRNYIMETLLGPDTKLSSWLISLNYK
ncbi:hypothetical protein WDW89_01875 [Deltaproteobacteria bacterium TL4]